MSHYQKFEIPTSWVWTNIGELLENRDAERVPVSSIIRKKQSNKIYDYYGAAGVIDKVDGYLFDERLLLIGEDGANLLSRAKDNAFFAEGKYWVNNHAHILDSKIKSILDYVAIVVNSYNLEPFITGSAQPKLSQDNLNSIPIPLPPLAEQKRILFAIQTAMEAVARINIDKAELSASVTLAKSKILELAMQGKLVPQDPADEPAADMLRRINPKARIITDNPHYPQLPDNWVYVSLVDIVDYEQPQPFIVNDTDYSEKYYTPVLTAGKSFILGYTNENFGVYNKLPVIIFDDFTTDSHLVNFPFKVKSSAMKILTVKEGINVEYVSYFMSITRLVGDTHKRYWISEYSKLPIPLPPITEQDRIVLAVEKLNNQIDSIQNMLN